MGRRRAKVSALTPVQVVQGHQELAVGQDHQFWVGIRSAIVTLARHDRRCVDDIGVPGIKRRLLHNSPVNALVAFCDGDAVEPDVSDAGVADLRMAQGTREHR
jgi:hypothetical protein